MATEDNSKAGWNIGTGDSAPDSAQLCHMPIGGGIKFEGYTGVAWAFICDDNAEICPCVGGFNTQDLRERTSQIRLRTPENTLNYKWDEFFFRSGLDLTKLCHNPKSNRFQKVYPRW